MRKLLLALVCMMFMAGLVVAAEYTIVSYKDKTLTVKDNGGKEHTAKITDDTKVYYLKGDEKIEGKLRVVEKYLSGEKAAGRKLEATIKDGVVTEVIMKGGRGKKKKN